MTNLQHLFESNLPRPDLAWRDDQGIYIDAETQTAWLMVQAVYAKAASCNLMDQLVAQGSEQVKVKLREVILGRMHDLQYTQAKVAATMGVTQAEVSRLLNGQGSVSIEKLINMAAKLQGRT